MASITTFICRTCHKDVEEAVSWGRGTGQCRACKNKEFIAKRSRYLKGLEALTIEERLAKLESWAYDYRV